MKHGELEAQRSNMRAAILVLEEAMRGEGDAYNAIEAALHILAHGLRTGTRP